MKEVEKTIDLIGRYNMIQETGLFNNAGTSKKVNYKIYKEEKTLYIFFQATDGKFLLSYDWIQNFRFAKAPYKKMEYKFKIHSGFLNEWKQIRTEIEDAVSNEINDINNICIFGWSLGGALATICHEDLKYCFPLLDVKTYTIGAPRAFAETKDWDHIKHRFEGITMLRNDRDIVPCLPPKVFGYKHVAVDIHIGETKKFKFFKLIKDHLIENYLKSLESI